MKQLIATFQNELNDGMTILSNGLISLEKNSNDSKNRQEVIETIFRTAHNLKGASRGLGISDVGDIAHAIESLFTQFKSSSKPIPSDVISLCLLAVDKMKAAMTSYINKAPLNFNLEELLSNLKQCMSVQGQHDTPVKQPVDADVIPREESSQSMTDESIRVPIKLIDKMSALTEEMQVSKASIEDQSTDIKRICKHVSLFGECWSDILAARKLINHYPELQHLQKAIFLGNDYFSEVSSHLALVDNALRTQSNDFSRLARALQDDVAELRLVPANNLLCLLPRYVRDLAISVNKKIDLVVIGGDVEIDKYVLEGLKDPINHILRNAVDHGIESAADRVKIGKLEIGKILIEVKDAGNKVFINISDDGAGVNFNSVKNKLRQLYPDMESKLEAMPDDQLKEYLFESGFTTKESVSDISGRGVGLDVVKKNILALKGKISLLTTINQGTTFSICVPLSLSSERGLIIRSDVNYYVIPTMSIEHVSLIDLNDIVKLEGGQVIIIDQHPIPVKSLSSVLGMQAEIERQVAIPVVILKMGQDLVALTVDEIISEREIVIKPIHEPLTHIPCIQGGALLDRNQIALVLDVEYLMRLSLSASTDLLLTQLEEDNNVATRINILVVDDSITTRTLEKNILESHNYNVTVAVNGEEAWDILQKSPFSLVITDVSMPIMDGFELTDRIKRSDKYASLPVIIVTSLGSDVEKARGIEVGADAYIVKSEFESGTLLSKIEQLV